MTASPTARPRLLQWLLAIVMLTAASAASASADSLARRLQVRPLGRLLMDGAVYMGGNGDGTDALGGGRFVSGVAIPDVRLGVHLAYGRWQANIEVAFPYAKLALKQVYLQFDVDRRNLLRIGHFVHSYGYLYSCGTCMRPSMIEQMPNEFFAPMQFLGLTHIFDGERWLSTSSVTLESEAVKRRASESGPQGWGLMTRQVWRPSTAVGRMAQVGLSMRYDSPRYNADPALNHTSFTPSVDFPGKPSAVTALSPVIDHARGAFALTPELMLASRRMAFETQYYYMHVFRRDPWRDYSAQGAYVQARGLLVTPGTYTYNSAGGGIATPPARSLELVVGYGFIDAFDAPAGIRAGISNDVSCTLNYYFNRWITARLRYSYTEVHARHTDGMAPRRSVNTLMARLQLLF